MVCDMNQASKNLELFHYGVKGMRWGVRRKVDDDGLAVGSPPGKKSGSDAKGGSSDSSEQAPKRSRKELRKINKEGADKFYRERSERIIDEVSKSKGDDILVATIAPGTGPYQTILSGREFAEHLAAGGVIDVRNTDIFARKGKDASGNDAWVQNEKFNERYQKVKR